MTLHPNQNNEAHIVKDASLVCFDRVNVTLQFQYELRRRRAAMGGLWRSGPAQ